MSSSAPDRLQELIRQRIAHTESKTIRHRLPRITAIDQSCLVMYARLLVAAEDQEQGDKLQNDHAHLLAAERAGEMHGFAGGYDDPETAARLYKAGRAARAQVHAAARPAWNAAQRVQEVLLSSYDALPKHIRTAFPKEEIPDLGRSFNRLWLLTTVDDETVFDVSKSPHDPRRMTKNAQTLLWWWLYVPDYPGRWKDMHALAQAWGLSDTEDPDSFRRHVRQLLSDRTEPDGSLRTRPAPPWALERS